MQTLNTKISQLEPKTQRTKRIHYSLRITAMVFSGITTVLLGLKFGNDGELSDNVSNLALIFSAAITFLSGLAVFWDIENYWIRNKIMLNKLKEIRYDYVFFLAGNPEPKSSDLKPFMKRYLSCLGDEYWEKFLKEVNNNSGDPKAGDSNHSKNSS